MTDEVGGAVRSLLSGRPQEGPGGSWDESAGRAVIKELAASGWLGVGLSPELGGEGGDLADAVNVVDAVTGVGWPSPAADLLLVTNTVMSTISGRPPELGPDLAIVVPAVATRDARGRISVSADRVAWAPWAGRVLVVAPGLDGADAVLTTVDAADALGRRGTTLHGAPWGDVRIESLPVDHVTPLDRAAEDVIDLAVCGGALARSVQSLAALRRLRELSVAHVTGRRQFGRRLLAFQAVQQHLALLAGEVAAAEAAVRALLDGADAVAPLVADPRLATARIRASQAAEEASRIAHQLHGAIGTAKEYELHRHTTALWSWREEFGNEHYWADRLVSGVDSVGDLWAWIADS